MFIYIDICICVYNKSAPIHWFVPDFLIIQWEYILFTTWFIGNILGISGKNCGKALNFKYV